MTRYVVGFFHDSKHVVLIRKAKPEWQRGLYNGVGGKIEAGETPAEAMAREFHEETGATTLPDWWTHVATLVGSDYQVFVFTVCGGGQLACGGGPFAVRDGQPAAQRLVEPVECFPIHSLASGLVVPNLHWLVPFATTTCFYPVVFEEYDGKREIPDLV